MVKIYPIIPDMERFAQIELRRLRRAVDLAVSDDDRTDDIEAAEPASLQPAKKRD